MYFNVGLILVVWYVKSLDQSFQSNFSLQEQVPFRKIKKGTNNYTEVKFKDIALK